MATDTSTHCAPAGTGPPQPPRGVADRIVRQIEAVDAWNTARRARERLLEAGWASGLDRAVARSEADALRRTQRAIAAWAADELAREPAPLMTPTATAVIAHRHGWFAEKVATLLAARGVTVIACTDNGADALGAVVAQQPDVVLAGDRLAMMTGDVLLAQARLFAPHAVLALQSAESPTSRTGADVVFLRHHPPADVADALSALCCAPAREHRRADHAAGLRGADGAATAATARTAAMSGAAARA